MSERPVRRFPWAVVISVLMAVALVVLVVTEETPADAADEIGSTIRCPVCQGVPIADSPAPMAQDMMAILVDQLESGASREAAIDSLLSAYPGSLLLDTPVSGSTLPLWLVPAAAIVVGIGLATTIRRSRSGAGTGAERREVETQISQIRSDLDDLASQEASGEIEQDMASQLRGAYERELAQAEEALASAAPTPSHTPLPRSRRRALIGSIAGVAAMAGIVIVAGFFITERPDATTGVAGLEGDPADYSNETLAAVIAENEDNPMIDGMRLALADRFFEVGDYSAAFPYYLDVADSPSASNTQAATALTRLGWMAYDGNGEAATALDLLAQAEGLAPDDPFPVYLQGIVNWCGLGRADVAVDAFRRVLDDPGLDDAIRARIENDLARVEAGEDCAR